MKIRLLSILFAIPFAFLISNTANAEAAVSDETVLMQDDKANQNAELNLEENSDEWRFRSGWDIGLARGLYGYGGWGIGWGRGLYSYGGWRGYGLGYGYPYYGYGFGVPYVRPFLPYYSYLF